MAKVPYNPVPSVDSSTQGIPEVNVPTIGAAFGENVAGAIGQLGKTVEGAGDEIYRRALAIQELDNRANADENATKAMEEIGIEAEIQRTKLGKDASADLPAYIERLKAIREKHRNNVTNSAARRLYDSETRNFLGRQIISGAGHAATQQKNYIVQSAEARLTLLEQQAFSAPEDDVAFAGSLRQGRERISGEIRGVRGWDKDQTDSEIAKWESKMLASRIQGLAKTNINKAAILLQENKGALGEHFGRTEAVVQTNIRQAGSRVIADEIFKDVRNDPNGGKRTLEEVKREARERAETAFPGDPLAPQYAEARVQAVWRGKQAEKQEKVIQNKATIDTALVKPDPVTGKRPVTLEQITADENVKQAFTELNGTQQRGVLDILERNSRTNLRVPKTPERIALAHQLRGMAQTDPMEFLGVEVLKLDLTQDQQEELLKLQLKAGKGTESDPRVAYAVKTLWSKIFANQLTPQDDKTGYQQFVGSLHDALQYHQQQKGKFPTDDEIDTIGSRLMREQKSPAFILPWSKDRNFRIPVPAAVEKRIRESPIWAEKGYAPTEEDIRRIWVMEQYKKDFPSTGGKPQAPKR